MKKARNTAILLFGVSNVGKTTTGRLLADQLNAKFYDLDEEIKTAYGMTLEMFTEEYEDDQERAYRKGTLLEQLIRNVKGCSVIAVSPIFYEEYIHRAVCERQVIAIYLRDTPEHIFDRLVFSDEHDVAYADDEYKNKHKAYCLEDIRQDILAMDKVCRNIPWRYEMDGRTAETIAEDLSRQIKERIQQENAREQEMDELQLALDILKNRTLAFPEQAFKVITADQEAALPYLRAAIDRAVREPDALDPDEQLHFYALFLLGQFQDKASFSRILDLASLPLETLDVLIGDAVTEALPDIMYNTFDGNIELLKQRIMDTEVDEFVRTGIASVLGQLYLDGRLPETEWKAIIRQVIHQAGEYEHVLDKMAEMICECHFIDMLGEIRYLFDHDLIDEHFVGGYDAHVDLMFNYDEEHKPFCQSPIDAAQILRNWAMFKGEDSADAERHLDQILQMMKQEQASPKTKIGRNDPCPCGSGKKYKNCCLKKPKSALDAIESAAERGKALADYPYLGQERISGRLYLRDYHDLQSIELDQLLYLGMIDRPMLIWNRDVRKEAIRTMKYLWLAFQKARELGEQEGVQTYAEFDERHAIHYYCRDWIGMLAELLEDGGKHEDAQAVIAWDRKMSA